MNKSGYYILVFTVMCLTRSAQSIECLQGQRLFQENNEIFNDLTNKECPDPSFVCYRYDISAITNGSTAGLEQAVCFPSDGCRFTICDTVDTMPDLLQPEKTLISCCAKCCDTDNCNNKACVDIETTTTAISTTTSSANSLNLTRHLWFSLYVGFLSMIFVTQLMNSLP